MIEVRNLIGVIEDYQREYPPIPTIPYALILDFIATIDCENVDDIELITLVTQYLDNIYSNFVGQNIIQSLKDRFRGLLDNSTKDS